jgi:pilus assembly protein CpaB
MQLLIFKNHVFRNRTVIGLFCIILSLIICFGITPLLGNAMKARTEIVRVSKDISKGEVITTDMIETILVGGYNMPQSVLKKSTDVAGKYAAADLYKGDYILNTKITDSPPLADEYLYQLPEGKQAVSISIKSLAAGLSGKLKPGDVISIIAADYGEERLTMIPPELQYIKVLAVTSNNGVDTTSSNMDEDNNGEQSMPSTVTLLANTTQGKTLAALEANGKIHIALVCRGNEERVNNLLDYQDMIISDFETNQSQEDEIISGKDMSSKDAAGSEATQSGQQSCIPVPETIKEDVTKAGGGEVVH